MVLRLISEQESPEEPGDTLGHWVRVVRAAPDACLVVDHEGKLRSMSDAATELLGMPEPPIGRHLLDGVLDLVDFGDLLRGQIVGYAERIPPLLAVSQGVLSRGLLRIRRADGSRISLDAIAAPLHDAQHELIGSVSFFSSLA